MAAFLLLALLTRADLSPQPASPPAIHIRVDQVAGLSAVELRLMIEEVERIWSAAGVRITAGKYSEPPAPGAATVSMRILSEELPRASANVLGWVTGDRVWASFPTVFISLPGVRDLLSKASFRGVPLIACPARLRDRLEAQALARVASHELGHFFVSGDRHRRRGLMRSAYRPADLLSSSLEAVAIAPVDRQALHLQIAELTERQAR